MQHFFMPSRRITPSRFRGPRAGRVLEDSSLLCYTHSVVLNGQCMVLCDTTILRPC